MNEHILTIPEVARYLKLSKSKVYGLVDHECEERGNETSTPGPSHPGFRSR